MATEGPVYQISIIDDEGQVTKVPMVRDEFTVGRKEGNVIRLTERNVSRNHSRIVRENGRFFLTDLGSYNGTRLNGRRVRGKMPLSPGDEVGIGDYTLRVEMVEGAVAAVSAPSEPVRPPQVTVVVDGKPGAVHLLTDVPHVIGRGDEATIRVDDAKISRSHARLHLLQGRYFVEDSGSQNGILIGGRRVHSKALDPGDIIDLGRTQLYFTLGPLKPEDIKVRTVPPKAAPSKLPMIFGIVGAGIAVAGVAWLLLGRNKGGTATSDAGEPSAQVDAGLVATGPDEANVALAPPEDAAALEREVPAPAPDEGPAPVDAGVSSDTKLAQARAVAEAARSADDWRAVLDLLADRDLASNAEAAQLRATATREHDARKALDEALSALAAGDPATAAGRLSAVPPDVRCSPDAINTWNMVITAGREAGHERKVDDLRRIVEALKAVVAPPPRVARGRDELERMLRGMAPAIAPPAGDAGTVVRPTDAGTAPSDARPRQDTATARDAGGTTNPPTTNAAEEAYNQARQMIVSGDNAGCINVLTRAPQTSRNLEVLVSCYKAAGRMSEAYAVMENYVNRFAEGRKVEEYRQILRSAGRIP